MTTDNTIELHLYVAGGLPNSLRALAAIKAYCRTAPAGRIQLTVVDVLEHPERALADSILLTPQLVIKIDSERHALVGDLSDSGALRRILFLDGPENEPGDGAS